MSGCLTRSYYIFPSFRKTFAPNKNGHPLRTLRLVILVSTVLITIIITIQHYGCRRFIATKMQFNINVSKSIRALYADMELVNDVRTTCRKWWKISTRTCTC